MLHKIEDFPDKNKLSAFIGEISFASFQYSLVSVRFNLKSTSINTW